MERFSADAIVPRYEAHYERIIEASTVKALAERAGAAAAAAARSHMTVWDAMVLGLVEGITEYLPISSTGHLILTRACWAWTRPASLKAAVDAFNIVIQGGAILAVLGLYWPRVLSMIRGLLGRDPAGLRLLGSCVLAFLPAALLGPFLDDPIDAYLFNPPAVITALAFWGVVMIFVGRWQTPALRRSRHHGTGGGAPADDAGRRYVDIAELTWKAALFIGAMQCLAMWPGTSRSMITIVAGMVVGMRPRESAEFSFLLALPTLGGACVFKIAQGRAWAAGRRRWPSSASCPWRWASSWPRWRRRSPCGGS